MVETQIYVHERVHMMQHVEQTCQEASGVASALRVSESNMAFVSREASIDIDKRYVNR